MRFGTGIPSLIVIAIILIAFFVVFPYLNKIREKSNESDSDAAGVPAASVYGLTYKECLNTGGLLLKPIKTGPRTLARVCIKWW